MARIDSISKTFNPNEEEPRLYKNWMEKGYFKPSEDKSKEEIFHRNAPAEHHGSASHGSCP